MRYAQGWAAGSGSWVPIYENSPVNTWRRAGRLHELLTPRGVVRAKKVVIATNGYTPDGLHPIVRGRLMNVLSNIVVTAPLSEGQLAATRWQTHKMVVDTRNLRSYFRLLEDNRIMFGARGGISDTAASRATMKAWLLTQLAKQFPVLAPSAPIISGKAGWPSRETRGRISMWPTTAAWPIGWAVRERGSPCRRTRANCWPTASRPNAGRTCPALVGAPLPRYEIPALRKLYQRAAYSYFYLKDEFL